MSKRRRSRATARPIDKQLIFIEHAIIASQIDTKLLDITFPATIVGLRWASSYGHTSTASPAQIVWAIVVVRDGETASTMGLVDGASFYTPEQNCLAFGIFRAGDRDLVNSDISHNWDGSTKTMRKMAVGDELHIITLGEIAAQGQFRGIVQFFTKS